MPMLNTRYISSWSTLPWRSMKLKIVGTDVGHAGHLDVVVQQAADGLEEALVHGEKGVADRLVRARELVLRRHLADVEEHAAGEGEAVRLETAGGQADDHVPGADGLSRDEPLAGDGADDRADEVVFVGGVEAGHFGGLAAEEGHVVLLAGLAEAADDLLEGGAVELGGAHVVHEEEGLRALHEDVVHAVVHDVLVSFVLPWGRRQRPPNEPIPPTTLTVFVLPTMVLMALRASILLSMFTPAAA